MPRPAACRRRRILLYTHALSGGGAERAWALLASGLARRGHEVLLVTDYQSPHNESYVEAGVKRVILGGGHASGVLALARLLDREKPDAALSALCVSNLKLFAASALARRRGRTILSYHGFFESEPQLLSRISFLLTPLLTRLTGRTLAVSNALRADLVAKWRALPERTSRIYNPVTWGGPLVEVTEAGLKRRAPLVLAVGRLIDGKNFAALLRAFAAVEPRDARLVILGEGPERARLEAEILRLGLQGRVDLPGYVGEPWHWYARASCLAVSSRRESFGMTLVEALAHGLPVVSTDCGGPREIISGGAIGRIVRPGDDAGMAGAISAALADPGPPGPRQRRAGRFTAELAIDAYEKLISRVAAEADARIFQAGSTERRSA